jgi:hypothetical protein
MTVAIYLYVFVCGGSGCDMHRYPMRDLDTCTKFAATFKPSFPPNTTENEGRFVAFCAGPHQEYYDAKWWPRPEGKR